MLLSGPIMLRNMLGPDNNIYLDQILAYTIWPFEVNFSVCLLAWNPYFIVVSAQKGHSWRHTIVGTIFAHNCANW